MRHRGAAGGRRHSIGSIVFHVLLFTAAGLLAWLGSRYSLEWDWSEGNRNSLSQTSAQLLRKLQAPLTFTAYVRKSTLFRQQVRELVARYQKLKPDIELIFVNPDLHPEQARQMGITEPIELEITYSGKRERLKRLSEASLTNALQRVSQRGTHWIVGLEGHGERRLLGTANHDLGLFGSALQRKGFHVQPLNLADVNVIPDNTRVLIVAGPGTPLLSGEYDKIQAYLERAGNLLWLTDPGDQPGLHRLADDLPIRLLPGIIVDTGGGALGLDDPAFVLVARYPDHPLTQDLQALSLFPRAVALEIDASEAWETTPILSTLDRSWNETGPIKGIVEVNPESNERRGPLNIGLAMTRNIALPNGSGGRKEQRLVVIGDGDFLSNAYLGNGGNQDLGLNIMRWLTAEDEFLNIPVQTAPDHALNLSRTQAGVIGLGFLLAVPTILLGIGTLIWWQRRRL